VPLRATSSRSDFEASGLISAAAVAGSAHVEDGFSGSVSAVAASIGNIHATTQQLVRSIEKLIAGSPSPPDFAPA
jgi:hypothetical protein